MPRPRREPRRARRAPPEPRPRRWRTAAAIVLVAAAAIAPFGNVAGLGFVGDDVPLILSNPHLRSLAGVLGLFGLGSGAPQARALRDASYALDLALGGGAPVAAVFHVSSLAHHVIATLLVLAFARRALGSGPAALVAALVFAVHPVHSEAVASIAGRKDLLVTILALAGLLAYDRFESRGGVWALAGFVACFGLGFLAKETIVVLPLLALAFVLATRRGEPPADRARLRRRWGAPAALLAASVALVAVALFVFRSSALVADDGWRWHGGSFGCTLLTIPRLLAKDVELLLAPVRLQADYDFAAFPATTSVLDARLWIAAIVLAVAGAATWIASRRDSRIALGAAWIPLALLPVLQIVPHHEILAERYLYLPSVGLALVAGVAGERAIARRPAAATAAIGAVLALCAARAWAHDEVFRDWETLSRSVVERSPSCARAQYNLGQCALRDGRPDEARERFRAAIAEGPGSFPGENRVFGPAWNEIGLLALGEWMRGGRRADDPALVDAASAFRASAAAWPGEAAPWLNLASLEGAAGRRSDAAATLVSAIRSGVRDARVDEALARAPAESLRAGDRDEATAARVRERRAKGSDAERSRELVAFLEATGRLEVAVALAKLDGVDAPRVFRKRLWRSAPECADGMTREQRRALLSRKSESDAEVARALDAARADWTADSARSKDALDQIAAAMRAWIAAERLGAPDARRRLDRALEATRAVFEGPSSGVDFGKNELPLHSG
jgi:protein O-mannosyl-transferase